MRYTRMIIIPKYTSSKMYLLLRRSDQEEMLIFLHSCCLYWFQVKFRWKHGRNQVLNSFLHWWNFHQASVEQYKRTVHRRLLSQLLSQSQLWTWNALKIDWTNHNLLDLTYFYWGSTFKKTGIHPKRKNRHTDINAWLNINIKIQTYRPA